MPGPHRAVVDSTSKALPALAQLRVRFLTEQLTRMSNQVKMLERELVPLLVPDEDVQRLVWIPSVGKIAAFTLLLEIDGIERFPSARDFVSDCRLVPGRATQGEKTRHKRSKDRNRYLKLIFTQMAVHAIQYNPEISAFYERTARRKKPIVARALVAKELARIVFYVLHRNEPYNGTFKGKQLSRIKANSSVVRSSRSGHA